MFLHGLSTTHLGARDCSASPLHHSRFPNTSRKVNAPCGNFYALEPARALGLGEGGAIRAGLAPYRSEHDFSYSLPHLVYHSRYAYYYSFLVLLSPPSSLCLFGFMRFLASCSPRLLLHTRLFCVSVLSTREDVDRLLAGLREITQ